MNKEQKLKLIVKEDSFHKTMYGSVTGVIYFDVDGFLFPEQDWDDFVVSLLVCFSRILVMLKFDKNKNIDVLFQEGPFKVSIELDKENQCTISFIEGEKLAGDKEIIYKTITIPFESLKKEIVKSCSKALQIKDPKKMSFNEDYRDLEKAYSLLLKVS